MSIPELRHFLDLSMMEIADMVRASGTRVCVFPFNGTRRWFLLEHGRQHDDYALAYLSETAHGYIRLYKLLFEHGIETIVAPIFGGDILKRGEPYLSQAIKGMGWLTGHADFMSLYDEYDVRVHFYGDYKKNVLSVTGGSSLLELFDNITQQTSPHIQHKLFYGVFGNDATEEIARISTKWYETHGTIPSRREIVEQYYGEYIEKADMFIGFERFAAYDFPMLNLGNESLYFTVAPSLYMTQTLLRKILYDHMYLRPLPEPDYSAMTDDELARIRNNYLTRRDNVFGVGHVHNGIWSAED
jgi:hypothetical protein